MPSSVSLQGVCRYGLIPLWILALFLIVSFVLYKRSKKKKLKEEANKLIENQPIIRHVTPTIKDKYILMLSDLKRAYTDGNISEKEGYRDLSFAVREFIEVSTGFDITKKTLSEIKLMRLNSVEELIEEVYVPEFSENEAGNLTKTIDKAITVIEKWS